jgi:hypothetical protein
MNVSDDSATHYRIANAITTTMVNTAILPQSHYDDYSTIY